MEAGEREGNIKVSGSDKEFTQNIIRTLWLNAGSLSYSRGYHGYSSFEKGERPDPPVLRQWLRGEAQMPNDNFAIIGSDVSETNYLALSIRPSSSQDDDWRFVVGWIPGDWEIGNDDQWFCEMSLPQDCFDDLLGASTRNEIGHLEIGAETDAWARDYDRWCPPSGRVNWYLRPSNSGDVTHPNLARGHVLNLRWENRAVDAPSEASEGPLDDPALNDAESLLPSPMPLAKGPAVKSVYIVWTVRIAFESAVIGAIAYGFDFNFFLAYGVWIAICIVYWLYRNIVDWIVYLFAKQSMVEEEVRAMEICKLPVDQFPYEELGTYLERIVENPKAPGTAKVKVGYYFAILERAAATGFLYKIRTERIIKEARIKYKQIHGQHHH